MESAPTNKLVAPSRPRRGRWFFLFLALLVVLGLGSWLIFKEKPPTQLTLADGRILVIEGITFGTKHHIGQGSILLSRLRPWLPGAVERLFGPKHPDSRLELNRPALVVWIYTLDAKTHTNVDCQMLRAEFVNRGGDLFRGNPHWYGAPNFSRVGHVFYAWPRDEAWLTFRITPYRKPESSSVTFQNPHLTAPLPWRGQSLPQTKDVGESELVLNGLLMRTNGSSGRSWESPTVYWEPQWEFLHKGGTATSWAAPEWTAEDPLGNQGQFLGVHQPVLKFLATVYPEATNLEAAKAVAVLPRIEPGALKTNLWWNQPLGSSNLVALGISPPGVNYFANGQVDPNPVSRSGPVRGGAPSGWTGASKQVNPLHVKMTHAHYSDRPTIYLRATELKPGERLAIRLKDHLGRMWVARPESQGAAEGIYPFLLDLPPALTNITAEVAILKPVQAEFYVDTRNRSNP